MSKALLMRKENGREVIAKIPCRIAGPARLTTASEVGVLQYGMSLFIPFLPLDFKLRWLSLVRNNTSIPVPRVFSWSMDSANPVGAKYIIMEKASGVPLYQRWGDMEDIEKLELIKNLTKIEAQFSTIRFPAYGGLYLRADANTTEYPCQMLDGGIDPSNLFCIGPSCDRSFYDDPGAKHGQSEEDFYQGPCEFPELCCCASC